MHVMALDFWMWRLYAEIHKYDFFATQRSQFVKILKLRVSMFFLQLSEKKKNVRKIRSRNVYWDSAFYLNRDPFIFLWFMCHKMPPADWTDHCMIPELLRARYPRNSWFSITLLWYLSYDFFATLLFACAPRSYFVPLISVVLIDNLNFIFSYRINITV